MSSADLLGSASDPAGRAPDRHESSGAPGLRWPVHHVGACGLSVMGGGKPRRRAAEGGRKIRARYLF
jgi:hypothetical protein